MTMYRRSASGLTLIELMVAVAIVAMLLAIGVPSMRDWMIAQRVSSVSSELATDMRYARAEAISSNMQAGVAFGNTGKGCYTVFRAPPNRLTQCDCTQPPGSICPFPLVELKTVVMPPDGDVSVVAPAGLTEIYESGSSLVHGGAAEQIMVDGGASRRLKVVTSSGLQHPNVCSPSGTSIPGFKPC